MSKLPLPEVRKTLKATLESEIKKSQKNNVAVLMSSGVDSHSILQSCLDAGIKPFIVSFTRQDRESRDFRSARKSAEKLGLTFVPVHLPDDVPTLLKYLKYAVKRGVRGKAAFECCYPMFCAAQVVSKIPEIKVIMSGYGADAFFALSKKGTMHYKDRMEEYAREAHTRYIQTGSQLDILKRYFGSFGIKYFAPWCDPAMLKEFTKEKYGYDDLNKPKQKWPVRKQFAKEFAEMDIFNHTNYQLGDSGISDMFMQLIELPEYAGKVKSPISVYNEYVRQYG